MSTVRHVSRAKGKLWTFPAVIRIATDRERKEDKLQLQAASIQQIKLI